MILDISVSASLKSKHGKAPTVWALGSAGREGEGVSSQLEHKFAFPVQWVPRVHTQSPLCSMRALCTSFYVQRRAQDIHSDYLYRVTMGYSLTFIHSMTFTWRVWATKWVFMQGTQVNGSKFACSSSSRRNLQCQCCKMHWPCCRRLSIGHCLGHCHCLLV